MKVAILAGGFGTRLSEESHLKPKPMVEIGDKPILWHIMKIYSAFGFNDFIICLGYKGYIIKEYFANYFLHEADVTFDFSAGGAMQVIGHKAEPWRVTLVNTGQNTMTGGRVLRIREHVGNEPFMLTYGDGVADIDIPALLDFHKSSGAAATITCVQPPGRFGSLDISDSGMVTSFMEKPKGDNAWINAGFFVMEPEVFKYFKDDTTILERDPLEGLSRDGKLSAFRHTGFWQPMDTLRDKKHLDDLWSAGKAPWKTWRD